jgi:tetratricopeptide (TPR) repeat protein
MQPADKQPHEFEAEGKRAFASKRYAQAAEAFRQAAQGYALGRDGLHAAEMNNNLSVSLLKMNRPQEAYEAAAGADKIFEGANDVKRQGMALGNQAAALDALKRYEESLALYERAAALLAQANANDLRAMVLKEAAAIRLKQGKLNDAGMQMLGSLAAAEKPSLLQRFLKFLLRFRP